MKILFIHPNMPGQYKHLARALAADKKNQVIFLTKPKKTEIEGVTKIEYQVSRDADPGAHRYLINFSRGILRGQEVWRVCNKLKEKGFVPDVICGHFGWGEGLFLKDIFHDTPLLTFAEYYYSAYNSDVEYMQETDDEDPLSPDECARIRMKNLIQVMSITQSDWCITPTLFQRNRHPQEFWTKMSVLHDGVDTDLIKPDENAAVTIPDSGITLTKKDEVVTYIARNFEPYRGFPTFMRAAEKILQQRPDCHIIIVGGDGVSYGKPLPGGLTFRQKYMHELDIDASRFHCLGYLPHEEMLKVMQISSAHIYLTVPFVLSWSMMEAMSAGCTIIASDTEPVREVIEDRKNGLTADIRSPDDVAQKVVKVLSHKDKMADLGRAARQTILSYYSLEKLLPIHISLVKDLAAGKIPPPTEKTIAKLHKKPEKA